MNPWLLLRISDNKLQKHVQVKGKLGVLYKAANGRRQAWYITTSCKGKRALAVLVRFGVGCYFLVGWSGAKKKQRLPLGVVGQMCHSAAKWAAKRMGQLPACNGPSRAGARSRCKPDRQCIQTAEVN